MEKSLSIMAEEFNKKLTIQDDPQKDDAIKTKTFDKAK